ncbi:MAG: endonuclease NucS [Candidatus Bathyarchaeota archaeon]|nr:endonuclease NucS [Candidatus Bathyarchaeum sp.]
MSKRNPVASLENPTIQQATEFIKSAVAEHKAVIVVGTCWVNYKGRASSKLEPGERMVIIKEDGSVLIHRPTGYVPVNWQPAGCTFQVRNKDETVRIRATRRKPVESLSVYFDVIFVVSAMKLIDNGEFSLHASESDMQKAILIKPSIFEEGFEPISYEKKVEPGFVDVYGLDHKGNLVVVELKRRTAGRDAALQLAKYVDCIKTVTNRQLRGVLVAPRLARGVQTILVGLGLEFKSLDPKVCADILQQSETKKLEDFFN